MSPTEEDRYTVAKSQFFNYQYLAAIKTLDSKICTSNKSDFLRFYSEFKHLIRSAAAGKDLKNIF